MQPTWEVIGGADKGGILVRQGLDLKSPQASARLSTGAKVQELQIVGERLNYKLLEGTGPSEGWVSVRVQGKELLIPYINLEDLKKRADSDSDLYTQVEGREGLPEWGECAAPPARGKFVPHSTGRPQAGKEWKPKLPNVPVKLRQVTPFDEKLRAKPQKEFNTKMEALGNEGPTEYFYGLQFPYTFEMIVRYGTEFLNKAFHAAGTLPEDNKIVKMDVEPFVGGSMSLKCFIHVEYEKPDPELHTDLFVKYPFPASNSHERKSVYIARFILNNDGPEMDFARILSSGAPMKCPKYYFGDICTETATALLITERLPLPGQSVDFGPYELESIPYKSVDYLLDRPFDYYDAMTKNISCLAAWGKCGKLGADIEKVFPPPAHPAAYFMQTRKRIDESFLPCVYQYATCLFPEEIVGKHGEVREDEWFVATLRRVMPEVEKAQGTILDYLFYNEDYCGFTHQNMNTDNAMFWRDENGDVCSGFIDWGRFKRDNFARGLSNGYMCCDLCELVQQSDREWITNFIDILGKEGGPKLDFNVFWEHYMLAWLLQGLPSVDLFRQLALTGSPFMTPEGWKLIPSYKDPRVFRLPQYQNGMTAIMRNFVYYWRCKNLPAFWEKWKSTNLDPKTLKPISKAAMSGSK